VLENARRVVAIELLAAVGALRWRLEEDPSTRLGRGAAEAMPRIEAAIAGGRVPAEQIEAIARLIADGGLEGL
jgi:histidine ammonia-lyase